MLLSRHVGWCGAASYQQELKKKDVIRKNLIHQAMAERTILQFARNPFIVNMFCSYQTRVSLLSGPLF